MMNLMQGDCLDKMKELDDNSVDIVIADLPYGRFDNLDWDKKIDLDAMWEQLWRISKDTTPICLFGDFKFANILMHSQPKNFRYEVVWLKDKTSTPLNSRKRFGSSTEYILLWYKKQPVYNYEKYHKAEYEGLRPQSTNFLIKPILPKKSIRLRYTPRLPLNVIHAPSVRLNKVIKNITEKPQKVLEHFLKYFSNEGDTCLDFCMGSGSTGVACHTLARKFIGIELHPEHFKIASKRLNDLPTFSNGGDTCDNDLEV
jgi:site-specific DNA-methyltransferase (adenine-specific)